MQSWVKLSESYQVDVIGNGPIGQTITWEYPMQALKSSDTVQVCASHPPVIATVPTFDGLQILRLDLLINEEKLGLMATYIHSHTYMQTQGLVLL